MRRRQAKASQRGATLIVGLIMLLLFTLMIGSAFTMSGVNLKAVGNMQSRDEAVMAANSALNLVAGTPFTISPAAQQVDIDLNNDEVVDYTVKVALPQCVSAKVADLVPPSSVTLPVMGSSTWNTVWDIQASVDDPVMGTSITVHMGVRVLLTEIQKNSVCS